MTSYLRRHERTAESPQPVSGVKCTCTGGPYVHGPEGLRQALRKLAAASEPEQTPPQTTEGDTDDDR